MKKLLIAILISTVLFTQSQKAENIKEDVKHKLIEDNVPKLDESANRFLLDEIVCTVHGPERSQIFTISDTKRAGLAGAAAGNLQDLVLNELIYQDALHLKLPIDESVIDNYIGSIQQQNNLTLDDVKKIFKASGYSFEEGREELKKMYAVNSMVEMKLKTNLVVPEQEVVAYYNEHPVRKEAKFQIQRGFIPLKIGDSLEELEKKLALFPERKSDIDIEWSDPSWLGESQIADSLKFIVQMNEGDICKPRLVRGGFEMYKLLKKKSEKLIPLKKRYREIVEEKRKPKFEQLYAQYTKELMDGAAIIYFNQPTA